MQRSQDELVKWLQSKKGKWPAIADASGLNYWWIQRFGQGRIPTPSHQKIKKLSEYATSLDGVKTT